MGHESPRLRHTGNVSIAPISAVRVAGIRPAQITPASDPYEDGLEAEAITEFMPVAYVDQVAPTSGAGDAGHAPQRRQNPGNLAITTGFDRTPAQDPAPARPEAFTSTLARALTSYAR